MPRMTLIDPAFCQPLSPQGRKNHRLRHRRRRVMQWLGAKE